MKLIFPKIDLYLKEKKIGLSLLQIDLESFLKIGMTCASLQMFGKIPLEMKSLIS